jgi:hypothetical protein
MITACKGSSVSLHPYPTVGEQAVRLEAARRFVNSKFSCHIHQAAAQLVKDVMRRVWLSGIKETTIPCCTSPQAFAKSLKSRVLAEALGHIVIRQRQKVVAGVLILLPRTALAQRDTAVVKGVNHPFRICREIVLISCELGTSLPPFEKTVTSS